VPFKNISSNESLLGTPNNADNLLPSLLLLLLLPGAHVQGHQQQ
jgi:hypothetical protein